MGDRTADDAASYAREAVAMSDNPYAEGWNFCPFCGKEIAALRIQNDLKQKYAPYLFDLVMDLSSFDPKDTQQAQKLKDRAVYLIYSMNQEDMTNGRRRDFAELYS